MNRTRAPLRAACAALALLAPAGSAAAQEYRSSVVGTDFDMILDSDPSTFACLEFKGEGPREMPDKTRGSALVQPALRFVAYYDDGTSVDLALDVDFGTEDAARTEALRYATRLGKLPTSLRRGVERIVVHAGEEDATAFSDRGLIVVYAANATRRIATHDLEETLFHESVHAAWDAEHRASDAWRAAQASDGAFATGYARENPNGEDLAESALFAYVLLHHPGRIPAEDEARIRAAIPARIAFVETLLPPGEPIFEEVGPPYACDGSGTTFTVSSKRLDAARASGCDVDISRPGQLSDILSNALMRGLDQDEPRVFAFLENAYKRFASSDELMEATVVEFGFERSTLDELVQEYLHCNCGHGDEFVSSVEPPTRSGAAAPDEPRADVALGATPALDATQDDPLGAGADGLRGILYGIAALLFLLLVVNAGTLTVLLRSTRNRH